MGDRGEANKVSKEENPAFSREQVGDVKVYNQSHTYLDKPINHVPPIAPSLDTLDTDEDRDP